MSDVLALPLFYEIAALLVLATAMGLAGLALRQPLIVAFIAVGILAGPAVFAVAQSTEHIELLADLGVALLLFLVGLRLDLHLIRSLGLVSLATGLGQIVFTSVIGLVICLALGMDLITGAYVAFALTFSSTIIIVKLLSDKRELDSLHGRIALGFLIVQDIVVVIALAALSAVGIAGGQSPATAALLGNQIAGGILFIALGVGMWLIADRLLVRLSRAPELLITFAIGWAALMASLGDFVGLGKEIGGLVAGVALSASSLRETLAGRLASVREFLLLFFFIALGSHLELSLIPRMAGEGLVLSLFVLIGNPLIVMVIMGTMGYRKRTGFLAGLTVAQISEFSLIFMAMGLTLGHVESRAVGLVTLIGLVTIAASTYMIYYSHPLYSRLERFLHPFERLRAAREPDLSAGAGPVAPDAVVFGLGRYGAALARNLKARGMTVVGADFDPEAVRRATETGLLAYFADVTDPDFAIRVPIESAKLAVCAIPAPRLGVTMDDPRLVFLQTLRAAGFAGRAAVSASNEDDAAHMRRAGADLVLLPFHDAADEAADLIMGVKSPGTRRNPESGSAPRREEVSQ